MQLLTEHDFFSRYLTSEVSRISAYIDSGTGKKSKIAVHETVQRIFNMIHKEFDGITFDHEFYDMFGSAYEEFKTNSVGNRGKDTGQHFTPIQAKDLIVKELELKPTDLFYECCAGSGGFINKAINYMYENYPKKYEKFKKNNIYANEVNPEIFKPLMIKHAYP